MLARARIALLGAALGLLALVAVWFAAFHIAALQRVDQKVLKGFVDLGPNPHVSPLASRIASLCNPQPYTVMALLIVVFALLRRRPWLALGTGLMLLAAPFTTETLKPLLAMPRASSLFGGHSPITSKSWPSGHATAAMSLALGVTLVAGSRWRSWAAAGGAAFAAAVCFSFLTLEWHYPSDVLGGFLIAFIWTAVVVAGVLVVERERGVGRSLGGGRPVPLEGALGPPAAALVLALLIGVVLALARPHQVVQYADAHTTFVVGGAVIGLLALGLATGVSLLARR